MIMALPAGVVVVVVVVVVDVDCDGLDVVVVVGAPHVPQHGEPGNQHFRRTPWSRKSRWVSLRIPP